MDRNTTVTEDELHAFVDGQLPDNRMREIEAWLENNPDAAALVAVWHAQNRAIHAAFDDLAIATEDDSTYLHASMSRTQPPRVGSWSAIAAAVLIFAVGAASGHFIPALFGVQNYEIRANVEPMAKTAQTAHMVYVSEVRHPVEVEAAQEAHLVAWLTNRLNYQVRAPNLTQQGFHLVGGRLLPVSGQAGALLMYEDAQGQRITLMIGHNENGQETGFKFTDNADIRTFYWIDGTMGFAVSGSTSREDLERLAHAIYSQI